LIELAYDAVLVAARWQSFLGALADALGRRQHRAVAPAPARERPGIDRLPRDHSAYEAAYCERFFDIDPFRLRSSTLAPGSCEMMAGGVIDASLQVRHQRAQ